MYHRKIEFHFQFFFSVSALSPALCLLICLLRLGYRIYISKAVNLSCFMLPFCRLSVHEDHIEQLWAHGLRKKDATFDLFNQTVFFSLSLVCRSAKRCCRHAMALFRFHFCCCVVSLLMMCIHIESHCSVTLLFFKAHRCVCECA